MLFEVAAWCAAATPLPGSPPEAELGDATRNIFQWTVFYVTRSPEWVTQEVFRSQYPFRRNLIGGLYTNALNSVLGHEYGHARLGPRVRAFVGRRTPLLCQLVVIPERGVIGHVAGSGGPTAS